MKKTYLLMAVIFLTWWTVTFSACNFSTLPFEKVEFIFPQWPPSSECTYPVLDKWLIEIEGPDISEKFYSNSSSVTLCLQKNIPCSVSVTPVTEGKFFFHPAGAIYPYYLNATQNSELKSQMLTWECGYSACLMQQIYRSKIDTGVSSDHLQSFQKSFNWKKLQDSIQTKIDESSEKFYNPWQLNTQNLLENLCYASFSSTFLNTKNIIYLKTQEAGFSSDQTKYLLSAYIPENQNIHNNEVLTLRKNQKEIYMYNHIYAAQINCSSSKKVSLEFTYLPIVN